MAKKPAKVALLSGGNPQIAKADGAAPVRAYIAAMPGWKRDVGRRLDRLICKTVPGVCKAVKWNSPFYGVHGDGYFLGYHCLTKYVKVAFFRGAELKPIPPGVSKQKGVRYFGKKRCQPPKMGKMQSAQIWWLTPFLFLLFPERPVSALVCPL